MAIDPIQDDYIEKIQSLSSLSKIEDKKKDSKVDSGLSSIEKSKSIKPDMIPLMNTPILSAPSNMDSMIFAVASIDASGRPMTETVTSFVLKGEDIKTAVLEGWMQNLREIEEHVRQLLSSPVYLQLQEIRQRGDSQAGTVSGVQSASAAGVDPYFLATLDRLQAMERVPATAEVPDTAVPRDSSQVLVLPLAAAMLAGGVLIGTEVIDIATHPVGGIVEFVQQLQPLFPQVSVTDLVPLINLMVVGPLYYHSWTEAVNHITHRSHQNYVQMAQKFAKDVIKIVADPQFVQSTLISHMKGTDQLSLNDQDRLARMLKIVLIGSALSLLYSVEVGKVQNGQFGGIEPEELRDLLLGRFSKGLDSTKKLNLQDQLTLSLIKRAQEQLASLSIEDRTTAANLLLDYVNQKREYDPMLDPAKVFDETLSSSVFNAKDKLNIFKI